MNLHQKFAAVTLLAAALIQPCFANKNDATAAVARAEATVRAAERSGAETEAAVELSMATSRLARAQKELDGRDWDDATRSAEAARLDAALAEAKNRALKAEQNQQKLSQANATLANEISRKGNTP